MNTILNDLGYDFQPTGLTSAPNFDPDIWHLIIFCHILSNVSENDLDLLKLVYVLRTEEQ